MYVKPGPHPHDSGKTLKVRIPNTHELLPDEGREVPENQFWMRRLLHGDVVPAEPPAPHTTPPTVAEILTEAAAGHEGSAA